MKGPSTPPSPRPRPGDLIAVRLPSVTAVAERVLEAWELGAAVLPVDARLPRARADALIRSARPTIMWEDPGRGGRVRSRRLRGGVPVPEEVALVVPTSGSRGEPKLVMLDRGAIRAAVRASIQVLGASAEDGWLCCLPLAHVGGLLVLLRTHELGAPLRLHPAFDVARVAAERDVAFTSLVPTMLVRLLDAGVDLRGFRAILIGGAPLDPELRGRAEAAGARPIPTYGLTESSGGVVYDGRALPGVGVRIGLGGEIWLGGPTLMRGYRADPRASAAALGPDGWLRTGDEGTIDAQGRLSVLGRLDDAIVTGGEKVHPLAVEAVLRAHPRVREASVVGRPDPEWGERVVAIVVPTDPALPPDLPELRSFVRERLSPAATPRELRIVSELPRTGSGKARPPAG